MKLIIDIDTGVDDAHAVILALTQTRETEIVAITCVEGNTTLPHVIENTLRVLTICKRLDIPVYAGAKLNMMGEKSPETHFHGEDGLGDTETNAVDVSLVKPEHASVAMVRIVNDNPGEVILFASAPLTNVAMAIRLDPEFGKKLKSATIMGGNVQGHGNYKIAGEFNFSADPEAAYITLNELQCPVKLITLELCIDHGLNMDWYDRWMDIDTDLARFNKRIISHVMQGMRGRGIEKVVLYDAVAMATLLNPKCIKSSEKYHCSVELRGQFTRGMMVVDWKGHLGKPANVELVTDLDMDIIGDMYMKAMQHKP